MSLINQMLSDLEARRPGRPADSDRALEGLQAAAGNRQAPERGTSLGRFLTATILGAAVASAAWYGLTLLDRGSIPQWSGDKESLEQPEAAAENGQVTVALIDSSRGIEPRRLVQSSALENGLPAMGNLPDAADTMVSILDHISVAGPAWRPESAREALLTNDLQSRLDAASALAEPKLIHDPGNDEIDQAGLVADIKNEAGSEPVADIELPGLDADAAIEAPMNAASAPVNGIEATTEGEAVEYAGTMRMQAHVAPNDRSRELSNALKLSRQGKDIDALIALADLVERHPDFTAACEAYAKALLRRNDVGAAERVLRTGLARNPKAHRHAQILAHLLVDRGETDAALETLLAAAPVLREGLEHHAFIAALHQRSGRHDAAIRGYRGVLALAPKRGIWWMGLGISLAAKHRPSQAQHAFLRALVDRQLSDNLRRYANREISRLSS